MSKGEQEDRISRVLTQWEKEYLGRGPILVKTDILRNMVIVVLRGILTPAEKELAKSHEGLVSVKRMRADLVESGVEELKSTIADIVEAHITSFFTDISIQTGERVIVFMADRDLTRDDAGHPV